MFKFKIIKKSQELAGLELNVINVQIANFSILNKIQINKIKPKPMLQLEPHWPKVYTNIRIKAYNNHKMCKIKTIKIKIKHKTKM